MFFIISPQHQHDSRTVQIDSAAHASSTYDLQTALHDMSTYSRSWQQAYINTSEQTEQMIYMKGKGWKATGATNPFDVLSSGLLHRIVGVLTSLHDPAGE